VWGVGTLFSEDRWHLTFISDRNNFQTADNHPTFFSDGRYPYDIHFRRPLTIWRSFQTETRAIIHTCTLLNSSRVAFSSHILGSSTIVQRAVKHLTITGLATILPGGDPTVSPPGYRNAIHYVFKNPGCVFPGQGGFYAKPQTCSNGSISLTCFQATVTLNYSAGGKMQTADW